MKILYCDDLYTTGKLPSSLFFRAHSGRIRYFHRPSTRTLLHLRKVSSSQTETVELSNLDLASIPCTPARFLPESTSHRSEVLLTRLTWGCFSRPRRRPASAPWSLLWVPPGAGMLGPRRQETEVSPGNGDLQWGLCICDASMETLLLHCRNGSARSVPRASLGFQPLLPALSFAGHSPVSNCEVAPGASLLER